MDGSAGPESEPEHRGAGPAPASAPAWVPPDGFPPTPAPPGALGDGGPWNPGPGAQPAWGGPAPYGLAPSAPEKRRSVLIAMVAGGGVLALVLLVVAVVVVLRAPGSREMADQAGRNLAAAAGVTYTGRYADGPAKFSVTRAGTGEGFFTTGDGRVDEVEIGEATYLRANADFWSADATTADEVRRLDGTWARAPYMVDDLYLPPLSPRTVGQDLRQAAKEGATTVLRATLHGSEVTELIADGTAYYISRRRPYTVLRVIGTADVKNFTFDVTPLTSSTMGTVFATLRDDVAHLENAPAPSVSFQRIGGPHVGPCGASGCLVRADATPGTTDTSIVTIRVTMTVTFGRAGHRSFTCSRSVSALADRNTAFSCRAGGRAWSAWYRAQGGRPPGDPAVVLAATQNSAGEVNALLRGLAQEQRGG